MVGGHLKCVISCGMCLTLSDRVGKECKQRQCYKRSRLSMRSCHLSLSCEPLPSCVLVSGPLAPPPGKETLAIQSPFAIPPLLFLKSQEMGGGTCKCPSLLASVLSCCVWLCSSQLSVTTSVLCSLQELSVSSSRLHHRKTVGTEEAWELSPSPEIFECSANYHNLMNWLL